MRYLLVILFLFSRAFAQDTPIVKTWNPNLLQEEWKKLSIGKGAKGDQGIQGLPGKDGKDGKDGLPGKDGKDATASSAAPTETIQPYTTGASLTVNSGTSWVIVNPSSILQQLTIFLPTSGDVLVTFGGSIKSGNVVKALTVAAPSGQNILQSSKPTTVVVGDVLRYKFYSNNWYRIE